MANYLPQNSGNWTTTTWITAFAGLSALAGNNTPPIFIDDVFADGKTLYIDTNIRVLSLRNTTSPRTNGLTGGVFIPNNGISLSAASIIPSTTTCVNFVSASPNTCTIVGNISGSATSTGAGLNNNSSGTINLFGSILGGGFSNGIACFNSSTGTINVVGNITGGTASTSYGYNTTTGSTLNVLGNVRANTGTQSYGIFANNTSATVSITGNVIGGSGTGGSVPGNGTVGCQITNGNATVYGFVSGGTTSWSGGLLLGVNSSGTGTVNIFGDCYGGRGSSSLNNFGAGNSTTNGTLNILGNMYAGGGGYAVYSNSTTGSISVTGSLLQTSTTTNVYGIFNVGTNSIITIYGNLSGGSGGNTEGVRNNGANSTLFVYGDVFGGVGGTSPGVTNNSTGSVYVYGRAIASNLNTGVTNTTNGLIYVRRVVGNGFGLGTVGVNSVVGAANTQNGRMYVEQVEFGPRGQTPISGPVYIIPSNQNTLVGYTTALGNTVTFYNSLSVDGLLPPTSSVQLGTVYNVGNSVGTMVVPSASAVQFGVPVDNTVGVAALTPQNVWGYSRLSATDVGSMGDRLRNAATAQSVGSQIASFNL